MEAGKPVGRRLQRPRQELTWAWVLAAGVAGSEVSHSGSVEGGTNKI